MLSIYLCGPTVYDYPHIGNIKPVITMDFIIRAYEANNKEVFYIHNITDIDDKIIKKALAENVSETIISKKYTDNYIKLLSDLNIRMPNKMPNVTAHIKDIIIFIEELIVKKYAYVINGNVYFRINNVKEYGSISKQKLSEMIYEKNSDEKENPCDFVLWKNTKIGQTWDSPWGFGRPGWHTECVVFIEKYNQHKTLDIHAGGNDLKFPHHENENAQFIAMHNKPLAKKWFHFGHLFLNENKMSKSMQNTIQADIFIKKYGANIIKLLFLLVNPLVPIKINANILNEAKKINNKIKYIFNNYSKYDSIKPNEKNNDKFIQNILELEFSKAATILSLKLKEFFKIPSPNTYSQIKFIANVLGLRYSSGKNTSYKSRQLFKNERCCVNKNNIKRPTCYVTKLKKWK